MRLMTTYRFVHLTVPTHATNRATSSLALSRSTVCHSRASSSFVATRCTHRWHAAHSHATLPSSHSACQPRLTARSCVDRGTRWWYVSGTQPRAHSSQASARVADHAGGGAAAAAT